MKMQFLVLVSLLIPLTAAAQHPRLKEGLPVKRYGKITSVFPNRVPAAPVRPAIAKPAKGLASPVTVLDIGTSADLSGYSLGTRTMLWADDDLNYVMNVHRMGPGAAPPGLEGYLAVDLGQNMGKTAADWTTQVQVQSSVLPANPQYYDAACYPSAGIYNPAGNTNPANARITWFNANQANMFFSGFGGYGYGTASLMDHSDTSKHIRWYDGQLKTNIPSGFAIGANGIVHVVDGAFKMVGGIPVYQDSIIYGRGVWNPATKDFDFTFQTLAFPCKNSYGIADCKVATSLGGNYVWISVLTRDPLGTPLQDSSWFPVLRNSSDGGVTWSDRTVVQLDGPDGLDGIKFAYSDYFVANLFQPPLPTRDEIPYTAAFDHSITVDKWNNLNIGIVVGMAPGGFQVMSGIDSINNVFDIFVCEGGWNVQAVRMGSLRTFRGAWGGFSSDNRVYASRSKNGEKVLFTWNDTRMDTVVDNQYPDVFARGYDLLTNKITSISGADSPQNVTALTSIANEAFFQCASPVVFSDNNIFTIPICTQWFTDPAAGVLFKYIPDFSFAENDFTISVDWWPWLCDYIGMDQHAGKPEAMDVFPNPAENRINVTLELTKERLVTLEIINLLGEKMQRIQKGRMGPGLQQFTVDVNNLFPGIYFVSVSADARQSSRKLVIQ